MKLIHYGASKYDPEKVYPIKNSNWVKPKGGLWTSPLSSEYGWKDWCRAENFRDCNEDNSFVLLLNENAKVLIIDSLDDLKKSPLVEFNSYSYKKSYLNFEEIAKRYDAIWLTESGLHQTHLSTPIDLYGWDCESVLILNPNCVTEILSESKTLELVN